MSACSKKEKEPTSTIDYDQIATCEIVSYADINAIIGLNNSIYSEDLSHIEIASPGSKSCTFSFNKTANPTDWHAILIYLSPKVEGSFPYEQSLNSLVSAGRNLNGNTFYPVKVNSNPTTLFWNYNYPYQTKEYQSHINEEFSISVSYYVSANEDFVSNSDEKLKEIFDLIVNNILSK